MLKTCAKCGVEQPLECFSKDRSARDGLQRRCKGCVKAYRLANNADLIEKDRRYYYANRERIRQRAKEAYAAEPQRILSRNKAWRDRNPDKAREQSRRYYDQNKDRLFKYHRQWVQANPEKRREYVRKYDSRNRANHRAYMAVRNQKIAESRVAWLNADLIEQRMTYYGNRCYLCGGPFEQIDHVKPIAHDGPHILANLRPICAPCNGTKGAKWPYDVRGFRLQTTRS